MKKEEIINLLNPEQGEAASTVNGPVLILAGAGTGKTRVITFRIAYLLASGIAPEQILGLTFTNKAAREMQERLSQLIDPKLAQKVTLGTFHSFCIRILKREIQHLGYMRSFTISDDSDQQGLIKQAIAICGGYCEKINVQAAQQVISNWKNRLLFPDEAANVTESEFEEAVASVYRAYQELLELQNTLDFDDMLLLVHKIFSQFPEVLKRYQDKFHYLLIDEYQDTNAAQFTIVKMLAGERCNLCVVGDDDQSIYSWRGADISNILNFPDYFPGTKVVKLERNYRSTNKILKVANSVINSNCNRLSKNLWSELGEGEDVNLVPTVSGEGEAEFIAAKINHLMNSNSNLTYNDFAILYRSNHLSRQLESSLRKLHIPYRLVGGQEFYKRKEIKDAVAYLKLLVNPSEDQSLLRIIGTPSRALAEKAINQLKLMRTTKHIPMFKALSHEEFLSVLTSKGKESALELSSVYEKYKNIFAEPGDVSKKIYDFLTDVGYLGGLQRIYRDLKDAEKRRENIEEFISAVAQFESSKSEKQTLESYLESYSLLEENDRTKEEENNAQCVTLCTVHASKGLEYKVVFLVALEENTFPHERAIAERSVDEELRLFYVAITRAKELLFISYAKERYSRGFLRSVKPSGFLRKLPFEMVNESNPSALLPEASVETKRKAFEEMFKMLE